MNNDNKENATESRSEYFREWRKKTPDRVARINERYWSRKAAEMRSAKENADPGQQTGNAD